MKSLRYSKCLNTTVELTFTTQKVNACSSVTACLGKFGPKTENNQFKLKFCIYTNSNLQNSMVMFTFFFSTRNTFLGKFDPKNQNCQFQLKIGT